MDRPHHRQQQGSAPSLAAVGLVKTFAGYRAVNEVDLTIAAGEIHALLGENGSGKSTLIKLLSGYHRLDGGSIEVGGRPLPSGSTEASYRLGCRFVHQDLGLVGERTVLDNLSLNAGYPTAGWTIRGRAARQAAEECLARVGLDIDVRTPVSELTPSLQTGVAVARALRRDPEAPVHLLVLDEPTATLPHDQVDSLLEIVRQVAARDVGVLYVSHRLAEVRRLADTVTVLRDGRRVAHRPAAELSHDALVELLTAGALDDDRPVAVSTAAAGDARLRVSDLASGQLRSFSVDVRPGEVVGVAGLTGSGRERALAAVFGAVGREKGVVEVDGSRLCADRPDLAVRRGVAYLPPDRKTQGGVMALAASHNISLTDLRPFWSRGLLRRRRERSETRRWFSDLGVRPSAAVDAPLETFSGGNQQKVLFAKWLRCKPRVLLLDEPTQGVDIAAKADLHHQINRAAAEGAAVVVSSADLDELVALSHRVLVIRDGAPATELSGSELTVANILVHTLGGRLAPR
jgi:ribose transport system ATP-binding protein